MAAISLAASASLRLSLTRPMIVAAVIPRANADAAVTSVMAGGRGAAGQAGSSVSISADRAGTGRCGHRLAAGAIGTEGGGSPRRREPQCAKFLKSSLVARIRPMFECADLRHFTALARKHRPSVTFRWAALRARN